MPVACALTEKETNEYGEHPDFHKEVADVEH